MSEHPHEQIQGELFGVELESTGTTDPYTPRAVTAHFVEHEGGHFPESAEETSPVIDVDKLPNIESVHAEVTKQKHRRAQLGKHSPLERDGTYLTVRPGDVLPGFGVVTYRNQADALSYAQQLEATRTQR